MDTDGETVEVGFETPVVIVDAVNTDWFSSGEIDRMLFNKLALMDARPSPGIWPCWRSQQVKFSSSWVRGHREPSEQVLSWAHVDNTIVYASCVSRCSLPLRSRRLNWARCLDMRHFARFRPCMNASRWPNYCHKVQRDHRPNQYTSRQIGNPPWAGSTWLRPPYWGHNMLAIARLLWRLYCSKGHRPRVRMH